MNDGDNVIGLYITVVLSVLVFSAFSLGTDIGSNSAYNSIADDFCEENGYGEGLDFNNKKNIIVCEEEVMPYKEVIKIEEVTDND